jgi:hypothetical protein
MADKNDNLFNRLTKLFRSGPTVKRRVKDYTKDKKRASSAVELFKKAHNDVYNSTLSAYGSFDRMSRYSDFGEMESTPEIASALDIYAEETCSSDVEGKVLHIFCEDRQMKVLLESLFYETLNINFNLVMWTRNLVKYGDFFLFNDVHPEFGVVDAYPITITEVEREEGFDAEDPSAVRFRWLTQGNTILENWQVSHFRLLGNDAFLPYGSSVLESARRIWRQLILQEDAMLLYRVVRAPERRVFYIDVGNVPPEDIANYVEQAKTSLKRNPVVNQGTGMSDLRYNPMAVDEDYFIPVRGGDSGTRIDNLAGGTNASAIEDVEYIQKKLFAALKIPKAYLGYDEEVGSKATLAQEDIRFSRAIQRIQKTIIAELNKIAMIHLFAHGYEEEQLLDFRLALSNPSSLAQQQKLELIKTKFDIGGSAPEGMVSKTWIYRNIFGFTKDEIEQIQDDLLREKLADMELEAAGSDGGGDEGGDDGGGDLFASDVPIMNPGASILNGITPQPGINEYDDFGDGLVAEADGTDDDDDEIDLARISAMAQALEPSPNSKKNVWGEEIKEPRKRESTKTSEKLHMPDFNSMVSHSRPQDTLNDPYQSGWLRQMGKMSGSMMTKESKEQRLADLIAGMETPKDPIPPTVAPSMSMSTRSMLERMGTKLGIGQMLTEKNQTDSYQELLEEHYDYEFDEEIDDE